MWVLSRLHIFDKKFIEIKLYKRLNLKSLTTTTTTTTTTVTTTENIKKENEDLNTESNVVDGFRVYEPFKRDDRRAKRVKKLNTFQPTYVRPERFRAMPVDQDWTNIWPTSGLFKQSAVPLPVHQGYVKNLAENKGIPPAKYGNTELMKIPNFLHLTPPHIKKHCEAIKKFCTPWPNELKTDEDCKKHFPVEIETADYIYAGPSIRDERSRIVTLKVPLNSLKLDTHARDKLIKLAEDRYDPKTDSLTIKSERCPYRKQNYDYVKYLLDVIFYESWKTEAWEEEINETDWPRYNWEKSESKKNISSYVQKIGQTIESKEINNTINLYSNSVTNLFDKGETKENIKSYKESVLKLLNLKAEANVAESLKSN